MSSVTDEVFGEIYAACKRKVSKDVREELRSLRAKAKRLERVEAENAKLRKVADGAAGAAKNELDAGRKALAKDREHVRNAARKVARAAAAVEKLKKLSFSAFIHEPDVYWQTARSARLGMAAVRRMVRVKK